VKAMVLNKKKGGEDMKTLWAAVRVGLGILLLFYIVGWVCILTGIAQIVHAATPENFLYNNLVMGIARILSSVLFFWIIMRIIIVPGMRKIID